MYETDIAYLLGDYDHAYTDKGVEKIDTETWEAKNNLREHLRKSPYWDEEQQAIVLKAEYSRDFDKERIETFLDWLFEVTQTKCQLLSTTQQSSKLRSELSYWRKKRLMLSYAEEQTYDVLLQRGEAYAEYLEVYAKIQELERDKKFYRSYFVTQEEYDYIMTYENLYKVICVIRDTSEQLVTDDVREEVKKYFPDVNCVNGQKCSKVVNAIAKKIGLDQHAEWNRKSAILFDGFNPLKYETYTIISINVLDYLTMAFGRNYASCHTIDKKNTRKAPGNYGGCYCSGTLSYALDESTMIFYTVEKEYDNTKQMWKADKIRRCCFYVSPNGNLLVESRVYPDGRDGGDKGIAAQFRAIMQDIVAQCWDIPNNWVLKKGMGEANSYITTACGSTHYRDYACYDDVNVSINKAENTDTTIYVGHRPICPVCGCEHSENEYLVCEYCRDEGYSDGDEELEDCTRCGDSFSLEDNDNAVRDEATGYWYCCESCAERDGVHYMSDTECWSSTEEYFVDDYDGNYYYNDSLEIETEEGYMYVSEYNARADDNVCAYDEEGYCVWVQRLNAYWSNIKKQWYTYDYDEEHADEEEEGVS